jgi:hypothetical protein
VAGLAVTAGVLLADPAAGAAPLQEGDSPVTTLPTTAVVDSAETAPSGAEAPETTTDVDVEAPVVDSGGELTDSERATRLLRWVTIALVGLAAAIALVSVVFWRRTNPGRLMAKEASEVGTPPRAAPQPSGRSERPGWSTEPARAATLATAGASAGRVVRARPPLAAPAAVAAAQSAPSRAVGDPRTPLPANGGASPSTPPPRPTAVPRTAPPPLPSRNEPAGAPAPAGRPVVSVTLTPSGASVAAPGTGRPPDSPHPHGLWASSGWDDPADVQPERPPATPSERPAAPAANPFERR